MTEPKEFQGVPRSKLVRLLVRERETCEQFRKKLCELDAHAARMATALDDAVYFAARADAPSFAACDTAGQVLEAYRSWRGP